MRTLCGTILAAVAVSLPGEANCEVDWAKLNVAAREQAKVPVRAGVPGVRPFWNTHAKAFIHPPAFDFKEAGGAKECRFVLTADSGDAALRTWTSAKSRNLASRDRLHGPQAIRF